MKLILMMMLLMFVMYSHLVRLHGNMLCFLIGLEYISACLLYFLISNTYEVWMFLFLMVYTVCEAVIGLSLLISMNFMLGHVKTEDQIMC